MFVDGNLHSTEVQGRLAFAAGSVLLLLLAVCSYCCWQCAAAVAVAAAAPLRSLGSSSSVRSIDKQLIVIFNLALHVPRDLFVLEDEE